MSQEAAKRERVIFLHMTKTAGGSLKVALERDNKGNIFFTNNVDDLRAVGDRFDIIFGHLVYGVHENLNGSWKYLTFLRHPLTRTISHFHQLMNVDQSEVGKKIQRYAGINEFFDASRHWEFENFMCKIVSGVVGKDLNDADLFQAAKQKMESEYLFVGIQEYMDLSILRLSHILGKNISLKKSINLGSYDASKVNRKTIDKILKTNQADLALYEYAINRFLEEFRGLDQIISSGRFSV